MSALFVQQCAGKSVQSIALYLLVMTATCCAMPSLQARVPIVRLAGLMQQVSWQP